MTVIKAVVGDLAWLPRSPVSTQKVPLWDSEWVKETQPEWATRLSRVPGDVAILLLGLGLIAGSAQFRILKPNMLRLLSKMTEFLGIIKFMTFYKKKKNIRIEFIFLILYF